MPRHPRPARGDDSDRSDLDHESRVRNQRTLGDIVENIAELGLKRPITVSRRETPRGPSYDLVCGQGRLEACKALGHAEVPALVVSADQEDCLVASLVENCARRQHRALDILTISRA